jgi:hypothetical protein
VKGPLGPVVTVVFMERNWTGRAIEERNEILVKEAQAFTVTRGTVCEEHSCMCVCKSVQCQGPGMCHPHTLSDNPVKWP